MSFLGGVDDPGSLAKFGSVFALAVDVSESGMQLVLGGAMAKSLLVDPELARAVQLEFVHGELKKRADRIARVRWSQATAGGDCLLGVAFDTPLAPDLMALTQRLGKVPPPKVGTPWWRTASTLAGLLVVAFLWLSARGAAGENARALRAAENARDECRLEISKVRDLLAEPTEVRTLDTERLDAGVKPLAATAMQVATPEMRAQPDADAMGRKAAKDERGKEGAGGNWAGD